VETDTNGNPVKPQLLSILGQMKKGRGLSMVVGLVKGDVLDKEVCEKAKDCRSILKLHMKEEEVAGFVEVIPTMNSTWSESVWDAAVHSGLGPLSPNSVLLQWPEKWAEKGTMHKDVGAVTEAEFVKCLKGLTNLDKAIMLFKGGAKYPCALDRLEKGATIDVWWVVHDGGLLLLMPYLISMHKVWRFGATIRIFVVLTGSSENPVKVQESIEAHLHKARITARVVTVDLSDTSIAVDMRTLADKTATLTARRGMLRELEDEDPNKSVDADEDFSKKTQKTGHKTVAEVFSGMLSSQRGMVQRDEVEGGAAKADVKSEFTTEQRTRAASEAKSRKLDENRMKTAVAFNTVLLQHSKQSNLVVTNLPLMRSVDHETDFCGYVEVMTEGVDSVLMIRGSGAEVVTTYG
jgi:potassium/chloride transporter 4/5/6